MTRKLLSDFPPGPLDRYRKQASFNWKNMKIYLESKEMIDFSDDLVDKFQGILLFQQPVGPLSLDETRQLASKRMYILHHMNLLSVELALSDTRKPSVVLRNLFYWDPSPSVKMSISYGMFVNVIRSLGTDRHFDIMNSAVEGEITGCFCLTEIGHGTNTKAMRTIATYDPASEEFILHSPDFQAAKCWAGSLGMAATHGVVYAQLYTPDNVCHGLHAFIVPIRHEKTLKPYAGVTVGDMGEKIGLNGIDNGFLMFDNYRIPRINLLNKTADVSPEGKYVTPLKDPSKRFGISLGALSVGRVNITHICATYLSKAITIAIRYSAVRKQFGPDEKEELPVLEYQVQQWRLLPYLAAAYVLRIFGDDFCQKSVQFSIDSFTGENKDMMVDLGMEIHAVSSASKPVAGWVSRDGIQECREACGGHGYLKVSGIGDIRNDNDANCTYEGENHVLIQQTSNWLLKLWPMIIRFEKLPDTPLGSISYLPDAFSILKTKFNARNVNEAVCPENILSAYKWLVCFLLKETADKLNTLSSKGLDPFTAKNEAQVFYARTLAIAYIEHFMMQKVLETIKKCDDPSIQNVLTKLLSLYGAWSLDKHMSILYQGGYASGPKPTQLIKQGILDLCAQLKPDAVTLVDVIAPHDFFMTSPLGQSDGEVYKNLQSAIFNTPGSMARPSWWKDMVDWKSYVPNNLQSKL